jgi:hypothetical protein
MKIIIACTIALATLGFSFVTAAPRQAAPGAFDPVGKWRVATASDEGQPMTVAVEISGKPGAYMGQAVTGERTLPLTDLATTPTGMIAFFALPDGFIVVRMASDGGRVTGSWAEINQTYALTADRVK